MSDPAAPPVTPPAAPPATPPAAPPVAVWYDGLEAELLGHAQNKNWDLADPKKAFAAAATAHRDAQKLIGVPETELLRLIKPSSPEVEVKTFWSKLGVPAEAKDYDFTGIKHADGSELDEKFSTSIRDTLLAGRVTKDRAPDIVKALVKQRDDIDTAAKADLAASIQTEKAALDKSWGKNTEANLFVAKNALMKLAAAANMDEASASRAWDALSKVGGIGAAPAMEMLRVMGERMGEGRYVAGQGAGGNMPMTREAAMAEITSLKGDPQFTKRYLEGGVEETKRMRALHLIAHSRAA